MKWIRIGALLYLIFLLTTISGNTVVKKPVLASENEDVTEDKSVSSRNVEPSIVVPVYEPDTSPVGVNEIITPVRIEIPSIGVEATIQHVGRTDSGEMGVPDNIHEVGWYEPGYKPGESGNAVLAGHVDGNSKPGAFYFLKEVSEGDKVTVKGESGEELTFKVTGKESYDPKTAPLHRIFGYSSKPMLNLITCTGVFNHKTGHYEDRLVVYTELVE